MAYRIDPEITPQIVKTIFAGDMDAIDAMFTAHPDWVELAQVYHKEQVHPSDDLHPLKLTVFELLKNGADPALIRYLAEVHGFTPHIGIEVAILARKGEIVSTLAHPSRWHMGRVSDRFHNMEYYGPQDLTVWLVPFAEAQLQLGREYLELPADDDKADRRAYAARKVATVEVLMPFLTEWAARVPVPMVPYPFAY